MITEEFELYPVMKAEYLEHEGSSSTNYLKTQVQTTAEYIISMCLLNVTFQINGKGEKFKYMEFKMFV